MVRLILLWNMHTSESAVTLFLAKKMKSMLEDRGHEVEIHKIPFKVTRHATRGRVEDWLAQGYIDKLAKANKDAFIVDLHTTPDVRLKELLGLKFTKPSRFKARSSTFSAGENPLISTQLMLLTDKSSKRDGIQNLVGLEMPAKYRVASKALRRLFNPRRKDDYYFSHQTDLKATKAANYLSPIVYRKLVHLIDSSANAFAGKYRLSRREPYQGKDTRKKKHVMRNKPK